MILSVTAGCSRFSRKERDSEKEGERFSLTELENHRAVWGVKIIKGNDSAVIYELNQDKPLISASTIKLFTTSAALYYLGDDFRFQTALVTDGGIDTAGILQGNLYVIGSGDPTISGRFYTDPAEVMRSWVDDLRQLGMTGIAGSLIGVDTLFKDEVVESSWEWGDLKYYYAVPPNELLFNDNCYTLEINDFGFSVFDLRESLLKDGVESLLFTQIPGIPSIDYRIDWNFTPGKGRAKVDWEWIETDSILKISGVIPIDMRKKMMIPVKNSTKFFMNALYSAMIENGMTIDGGIRDFSEEEGGHHRSDTLFIHESPPLSEIVKVVNTESVNLYAEQLLRITGYYTRGKAGASAGLEAVKDFSEDAGIAPEEYHIVDGSGLSRHNWVSAEAVVKLLRYCDDSPFSPTWMKSLAGPGEGTMNGRSYSSEIKELKVKTGSMSGVRAVSGYMENSSGQRYIFSIICNNYICSAKEIDMMIDDVINRLAKY